MALMTQLRDVLGREGLFVEEKFEEGVRHSKSTHQPLDRVLLTSGYLTETQMLTVFGECLGLKLVDRLGETKVPSVFVERVPVQFARHHNLVGIGESAGMVRVASCFPLETHPIDDLSVMLDRIVEPVLATRAEITSLINRAYQAKSDVVDEIVRGVPVPV